MVQVNVEVDQSGVYSMVRTFTTQLQEAEAFALAETERVIRYTLFDEIIHRLGRRAGNGWAPIYSDHLSTYMRINVPIFTNSNQGRLSIGFDLNGLGDYTDLERSAHHRAILAPSAEGFTKNLPRVQLPYNGEELFNSKERREEFWEEVIIGRNLDFEIGPRKGNRHMTAGELGDIPTFSDVAEARVQAWVEIGKAPQWLWLENGFTESTPEIYPVDFTRTLELITICVASRIYEGAITTLVRIAEEAGQRVAIAGGGAFGRVRSVDTGQFVSYRKILDESIPDYSGCLGTI